MVWPLQPRASLVHAHRPYSIVIDIRSVLDSRRAPIRPDWEGMAEYMELHDANACGLDARRAVEGS